MLNATTAVRLFFFQRDQNVTWVHHAAATTLPLRGISPRMGIFRRKLNALDELKQSLLHQAFCRGRRLRRPVYEIGVNRGSIIMVRPLLLIKPSKADWEQVKTPRLNGRTTTRSTASSPRKRHWKT